MPLAKEMKQKIIKEHGSSEKDPGSTAVQIALLSARIKELTAHLKIHGKDHHTRYGLLKMVSKRRSLLDFLKKKDVQHYRKLIEKLDLRK
jgi:small subunit ribosomal protein S15